MLCRTGSPLAIVHALALTTVTLLTGAWEACGHGHDAAPASLAWYPANQETGAGRATVRTSDSHHEHSCVACDLSRPKTAEPGKAFGASPRNPWSTAAKPVNDDGQRSGERRPQTARGPPTG